MWGVEWLFCPRIESTMETLGCYWRDILQREDDNLQELICNNFHQENCFCRARLPGLAI